MDFTFDMSQTPVIGRKILTKPTDDNAQAKTVASPRRSCSLSPADTAPFSGWKRPWMSQVMNFLELILRSYFYFDMFIFNNAIMFITRKMNE